MAKSPLTLSSSRTVTPSIPAKRPRTGSKTTIFKSYHGQHSLQTSNPIEHIFQHLKRKLGGHPIPPGGIPELWERVEKEWEAIPQSVCRDLVESMPRKVAAVIEAKGGTQSTDNLMQLSSDAATKLFQCCLPNAMSKH